MAVGAFVKADKEKRGTMKHIIQVFIVLLFIGTTGSSARCETSIHYSLCKKNVKSIDIVLQGNLYSLRIALTESAAEDFYLLTKDNIGKTLNIVFEDAFVTGADIDAPVRTGFLRSVPATKEGAGMLRQRILDDKNKAPCGQIK